MADQATRLRSLMDRSASAAAERPPRGPKRSGAARVLAVTSGKGGVGKTHVAVNLAVALAARRRRVVLFDADLGLANVDILLGLKPEYTLSHVVEGKKSVKDVLLDGPAGLKVLPGSSGIPFLANLTARQREHLLSDLSGLEENADVIIIDTGAGISDNTIEFAAAADQILVVTTPEATSVTDAYATVKTLARREGRGGLMLCVNMAANRVQATRIGGRISEVAREFLDVELVPAGYVVKDEHIALALRKRTPLVLSYPNAQASACLRMLSTTAASRLGITGGGRRGGFFAKIRSLFTRGAV